MKNEKHVALAKQVYHEWKINNYEVYSLDQRDVDRLLEIVAAALSQVESEALASKVELPTDETIKLAAKKDIGLHREDNRPKTCTNKDFYIAVTSSFIRGAKWALSQVETEALASKVEFPRDEVVIDAVHADAKKCCESCYYKSLNAEVTMLHTIKKFRDKLTLAPNEQVIRVPKDDFIETKSDDGKLDKYFSVEGIKRLNKQARIEESNE